MVALPPGVDQPCSTTPEQRKLIGVKGWAFIEGHDSVNSEKYIVLKSAGRTYVFTTETVIRENVTRHFEELGLNLDYSGFVALIPARRVHYRDLYHER